MTHLVEAFPGINGAVDSDGNYRPLTDFDDTFDATYPEISDEVESVELPPVKAAQEKAPQLYKSGPLETRFDTLQETMDAHKARLIVGAEALDAEMNASLATQFGETPEVSTLKKVRLNYKTGPAFVHEALEAARNKKEVSADADANPDIQQASE